MVDRRTQSGKHVSPWHSVKVGLIGEMGILFSWRIRELFSVGEQLSFPTKFSQACRGLLILSALGGTLNV